SGYTGMGDSLWTPEFAVESIYTLAEPVTWLRGRHSLKLGVDFRRQQRNFFQVTAPRGWYSFDGQYTQDLTTANGGNGLADLLLGPPNFFEQDALVGEYPTRYWDLAEFIQDDFRATPNLTLNLGLRYEVTSPANGRVGNFDLQRAVVVNSVGSNAVPHAGVEFDKSDWAPRFGLAYAPFGNKHAVVRSAFGVFYSAEANIFDDLGLNPPFLSFDAHNFNAGQLPQAGQLISTGFPAARAVGDPINILGAVKTTGPKRIMPRIMEWNLSIEHQFVQNWVAQVGYVGTRAYHLWNHEMSDLNQAPQILDTNFCGTLDATGACTQPNFGRRYFAQQPNMGAVLPLDYAQLQMVYNAFQGSLNKRFADGFNVLAAYTFAKNLGNADGNVGGF